MSRKGVRLAVVVAVWLLTTVASATAQQFLPPVPSWVVRGTCWGLLLATCVWAFGRRSGESGSS